MKLLTESPEPLEQHSTGKIFISYRREDSATIAGRIYDHLTTPIGPFSFEDVFKDVDSIPVGVDFRKHLAKVMGECEAVLVIIGPQWLTMSDSSGKRRLDNPGDWVRLEVEAALNRDILVIPLLVMGAEMPSPAELPESLSSLVYRNAAQIRNDPDFKGDMQRLNKSLGSALQIPSLPVHAKTAQPVVPSVPVKRQVVISYCLRNQIAEKLAEALNADLKAAGYQTWIDFEHQTNWNKTSWREIIHKVISESAVLVTVYTDEQKTNSDFNFEIETARQYGLPIIVILPKKTAPPDFLINLAHATINVQAYNDWTVQTEEHLAAILAKA